MDLSAPPAPSQRLPRNATLLKERAAEKVDRLKELRDSKESSEESLLALLEALQEPDPWTRAAQLATRIAVIGLILYLVQILVNLYRYNVRLASFYEGLANAVELSGRSTGSFAELASAFRPDFGFGKSPEPVPQQITDLARDLVRSGRAGPGS